MTPDMLPDIEFDTAGYGGDEIELLPHQQEIIDRVSGLQFLPQGWDVQHLRLPLYFDLETVPDLSRAHLFNLPSPPPERAISQFAECPPMADFLKLTVPVIETNLLTLNPCDMWLTELGAEERVGKNRDGVHKAIKATVDARGERERFLKAQNKKMSVTPEYCRIVAMGWAIGNGEPSSLVVGHSVNGRPAPTEVDILEFFWRLVLTCNPIVGYNVAGFDLPVILIRSALLGVDSSRRIDLKPWGNDICDLMAVRFPRSDAMKLKDLARCYGIPVPAEGVDGSQVAELFENDPARLGEYVRSDVVVARGVHKFYSGYFC